MIKSEIKTEESLKQMQSFIKEMGNKRRNVQLEWNKNFPPNIEIDVIEDDIPVTYGIWEDFDGIFIIPKSKNGYQPERRITIDKKIVKAIKGMK